MAELNEETKKDSAIEEVKEDLRFSKSQETIDRQNEANAFYTNMKSQTIAEEQEANAEIKADAYVELVKEAVKANDSEKLIELMGKITFKARDLVCSDEATMRAIMAMDKSVRIAALDVLYPGIQDVELFRDVFRARFNLAVGTDKLIADDFIDEFLPDDYKAQRDDPNKKLSKKQIKKNKKIEEQAREAAEQRVKSKQNQWSGVNKDWSRDALVHLYHCYLRIPESQLALLKSVTSVDSASSSNGGATSHNIYYLSYKNDTIDVDVEGGKGVAGVTDSRLRSDANKDKDGNYIIPRDSSEGLMSMDTTIVHELGHVVDFSSPNGEYNPNAIFSSRPDFRSLSGWQDHGKDPATVVKAVIESLEDPYEKLPSTKVQNPPVEGKLNLSDNEIELAKLIGERMIQGNAFEDAFRKDVIVNTVAEKCHVDAGSLDLMTDTDAAKVEEGLKKDSNGKSDYTKSKIKNDRDISTSGMRGAKELTRSMMNVGFLSHIQRALANSYPFFDEKFSGMKRQIHEGYKGQEWFSYENAAWDNGKISKYQFREPCEEFAELYASYHVAADKGSHTPPKLRAWFEAVGLDKALPEVAKVKPDAVKG